MDSATSISYDIKNHIVTATGVPAILIVVVAVAVCGAIFLTARKHGWW